MINETITFPDRRLEEVRCAICRAHGDDLCDRCLEKPLSQARTPLAAEVSAMADRFDLLAELLDTHLEVVDMLADDAPDRTRTRIQQRIARVRELLHVAHPSRWEAARAATTTDLQEKEGEE